MITPVYQMEVAILRILPLVPVEMILGLVPDPASCPRRDDLRAGAVWPGQIVSEKTRY
jgi:hypothetical protein